jgi:hypothetical protein
VVVLLAGMPMSGSTFSFNVVPEVLRTRGRIYQEACQDIIGAVHRSGRADHLLIKTHNLDATSIELAAAGVTRIIVTVRHVGDAMASWFDAFDALPEAFAFQFMRDWLRLFQHLHSRALVVSYEEIDRRPWFATWRIARATCPAISPAEVIRIARRFRKAEARLPHKQTRCMTGGSRKCRCGSVAARVCPASQARRCHPRLRPRVRRYAGLPGVNLDPDHMARLVRKEGGGYSNVSPAGALGPMQLMPGTAAQFGVNRDSPWQTNIHAGMLYYRQLPDQFGGNYAAADAAYNAGPNNAGVRQFAANRDASALPPETRDYVATINRPVAALPRALPAAASAASTVPSTQSPTNSIVINGGITVNTQATDAKGVARDIYGALVIQANRGPQWVWSPGSRIRKRPPTFRTRLISLRI